VVSISENKPLFSNLQDEPVLYRKFVKWVKAGLREAQAAAQALKSASEAATNS
jgi:hypothetical protein